MKNILAVILVLALGVFAYAQFDMQRSPNINNESNPILPEITNDLSHLGAAYTIGMEAGNLTGNYGNYFQVRMFPKYSSNADIGITIVSYDKDGNQMSFDDISLELGILSTFGEAADFNLIIDSGKLFLQFSIENWFDAKETMDIDLFGMLGGYIDYVAISGSKFVYTRGFQFGNGWVSDEDNYGYTNMQLIHGYAEGFVGTPLFTNGSFSFGNTATTNVTFTSKALGWNAETGAALSGTLSLGGFAVIPPWNNFTITFGSLERVPAAPVPEPATLLMLGLGLAGLPVVRRLRRR